MVAKFILAERTVSAQHSVQRMVGTGRIFGQVSGVRRFPVEGPPSPPHHR
jgi:hypothetical protein